MPKQLLFVESNTTGTGMLALRTAAGLGLEPVFLTADPDRYPDLAATGAAVMRTDTNSADALRQAAGRLPRAAIAGVTTTSDFYLSAAAGLADSLGLPGNPPQVLRVCRDKASVRAVLTDAGLAQPRYAEVRSPAAVADAVGHVGLPCVVKPVDDSGSYNVRVCATLEEAAEHCAAVLAVKINVRGQPTAQKALIEHYIDGPEFSVETFSVDGATECVGVVRKTVSSPPYCVETGHLYPAGLDGPTAAAIVDLTRMVLKAVGVQSGPAHTEIRVGAGGPSVIELNCRLAGGMIPELVRRAEGVDLVAQQLMCAIGAAPQLAPTRQGWAGIRFITAGRPGVLREVRGIDTLRRRPGIVEVTVTAPAGRSVTEPRCAYDRLGYIIAAGDSAEQVTRALDAAGSLELVLD